MRAVVCLIQVCHPGPARETRLQDFPGVSAQLQHRRPADGRRVGDVLRAAAAEERGAVPDPAAPVQHPQRVIRAAGNACRIKSTKLINLPTLPEQSY